MGNCSDKKHTCGSQHKAICVIYKGYLPEDSALTECLCNVSVEEAIEELYKIADTIKSEIDLSNLGDTCIDYEEEETGKIKVNEALGKHEELICEIKETLEGLDGNPNIDISNWDINTYCLEDVCGTGFSTLPNLLQALIEKVCTCCP